MHLPKPSIAAGCKTKSVFWQSLTSLDPVFLLFDQFPYHG